MLADVRSDERGAAPLSALFRTLTLGASLTVMTQSETWSRATTG